MSDLVTSRQSPVESLARQTGFSVDAVESMRASILRGGGRMAQFDHPEFGGPGQWMAGGMLMIAAFDNPELKRRVDRLCEALADWVARDVDVTSDTHAPSSGGEPARHASWYPAALGTPTSSGSQNRSRYAWFSATRRLAIDDGHAVTVYDTGDHRIGGVSQQQGSHGSLSFASQHGTVDVARLPVVDATTATPRTEARPTEAAPRSDAVAGGSDPFVALEKLAALHARGILGDAEFAAKKAELLERI